MIDLLNRSLYLTVAICFAATYAVAQEQTEMAGEGAAAICEGFGPQTPRDIDSAAGENSVTFSMAPAYTDMNLCNIHFHQNAEHKAEAFSLYAGDGKDGVGGGYMCTTSSSLSDVERAETEGDICNGLKPGDTIEVHWVFTTCDVTPGPGLGACLSDACANPGLRVETQVFTLVNNASALDFAALSYDAAGEGDYHQPKALPMETGNPVQFLGSTTGPKFTEQVCSPLQVSWSVRPLCAKLDINSLGTWCEDNVFNEDHAHGVRKLVTNVRLLSRID